MIPYKKTGALFIDIEIFNQKEGQHTAPTKDDKETAHIHTHYHVIDCFPSW